MELVGFRDYFKLNRTIPVKKEDGTIEMQTAREAAVWTLKAFRMSALMGYRSKSELPEIDKRLALLEK